MLVNIENPDSNIKEYIKEKCCEEYKRTHRFMPTKTMNQICKEEEEEYCTDFPGYLPCCNHYAIDKKYTSFSKE